MKDLAETRKAITEIDEKMAFLFEQRMKLASDVAAYKKENGMPIFDSARENEILKKNLAFIKDHELQSYYLQFIQNMMDVSKRYQHKLLEGTRIAYSGIEGAFANIAARKIFPDGNLISYTDFKSAYDAVENGECDLAVLPIENSYAGEVGQVSDLMFLGKLFINGVYSLPVTQNLLSVKGAKIEDITTVVSHPQALEQCAEYIRKHGWEAKAVNNTARAAKQVAELNDKSVAAIASHETAELYGLSILDHDINENSTNTTRFAVFSKVREERINSEEYSTFIIMFVVKNESGSLAKAINIIGDNGYNMRVLRSRPLKDSQWEYYFYVEAEGKLSGLEGEKMIKELNQKCQLVKILGSFNPNDKI
ncbi:MAG: chorismate mutase [Treponemataceae bacterium]|nr:chorismate mutase [Treponemataceae bacterium]